MYQVRILDKNRQLKAILPGVRWYFNRRINEATPIEVYIPRTIVDEHIPAGHSLHDFFNTAGKLRYAEIASLVQVYKGGQLKATGKINGRNLGQIVTIYASTEEILMESNVTPAQYGAVWDGWDLADVARDLLDKWHTLRVKDQSQWQQRIVASQNVDLTTEPGVVMLAKRSNGRYYDSGHLTLKFDKSEIMYFKRWDRVRWSADSDGTQLKEGEKIVVQTTIQVSTNGISFTAPFDGGLPEEVGYAVAGASDSVWIRINLLTNDTESEDSSGNPVGVTPYVFACELIARTEGDLIVGNIPTTAGTTVKGLSANYATALKVLYDACAQAGWEFSVWDGSLNLAEALGTDRTKSFVFRSSTNTEIQSLGDSDEMVNVLTAYGPGSGINRLQLTLHDWDSISEYGEYPGTQEFNAETHVELQQKAQKYLDEHSQPQMDFRIAAVFEYGNEPDYGLGDTVKVADPDTGIISTTRIVAEAREYNEDGLSVHLELGKPSFKLSEAIGRDGKDGKDGKDGRDGRDGKDGKDGVDGDVGIPDPADPEWLGYTLTNVLHLAWHKAEHATGYEIRTNLNWGAPNGMLFRGYAQGFDFVPSEREMILYIKALNPIGVYSEGYDTLSISIPAPKPPSQPTVVPYFTALQVHVTPLNDPSVMGYYVYMTKVGAQEAEKTLVRAGEHLTYPAPSGTSYTVQVSAFDILGEGGKSEPLQAATTYIDEDDLPDDIIKARHMETLAIKTKLVQAQVAYLDEANALYINADRLRVGGTEPPGIVSNKPSNAELWHFDNSLKSTQGLSPVSGSATLTGGKFGGGVSVNDSLSYQTDAKGKHTVVVYKAVARLSDYAHMSLQQMADM